MPAGLRVFLSLSWAHPADAQGQGQGSNDRAYSVSHGRSMSQVTVESQHRSWLVHATTAANLEMLDPDVDCIVDREAAMSLDDGRSSLLVELDLHHRLKVGARVKMPGRQHWMSLPTVQ